MLIRCDRDGEAAVSSLSILDKITAVKRQLATAEDVLEATAQALQQTAVEVRIPRQISPAAHFVGVWTTWQGIPPLVESELSLTETQHSFPPCSFCAAVRQGRHCTMWPVPKVAVHAHELLGVAF